MGVPPVEVCVVWDELRPVLCSPPLVHGCVHGLLVPHAERDGCPGNGVNALGRAAGKVERRERERGEREEREVREEVGELDGFTTYILHKKLITHTTYYTHQMNRICPSPPPSTFSRVSLDV